ncbi:hypothetical protein GCM10020358_68300 [Amorphoplanes nipponensis]|uniref:Uncharacterized protein n=2 Tax=Actinoplanes nipponensis TaxID=135950 RepID=A0A919MVV0_9ACTN|nr:hypothetical protein Ani05nite_50790 [Actinoplanes nipponensis]
MFGMAGVSDTRQADPAERGSPQRTWPPKSGGVLLIDLENMIGRNAKSSVLAARIPVLIDRAGPTVTAVAACAGNRITPAGMKILKDNGIELLTVDWSKDAADDALLAEAQRRADAGCSRFVAASNDSRFARLADLGDLEVLIWATQKPRTAYIERAVQVYRLPVPAAASTVASTTPRKAPADPSGKAGAVRESRRPVSATTKVIPSTHNAAPDTRSERPASDHPSVLAPWGFAMPPAARPVLAGVGVLVAGLLFGTGAALGELTVRHLHRQLTLR